MTAFVAQDPAYADRVRDSFGRQRFMMTIGAQLTHIAPGYCEITLPFDEAITQQHGFFHGGVTGSIADSAAGYAAFSLMPADSSVLTVEYKLNLVAPGRGEALVARADVVRSGRTLTVAQVSVFARTGDEEILCATALETLMCLPGQDDARAAEKENGEQSV